MDLGKLKADILVAYEQCGGLGDAAKYLDIPRVWITQFYETDEEFKRAVGRIARKRDGKNDRIVSKRYGT